MITRLEFEQACSRTIQMFADAGIILTPDERKNIEVADFGLNDLQRTGLQLITYINTTRVCAKELVLFPNQTCPEHFHPSIDGKPGKEETFRCRAGNVHLFIPGEPTTNPLGKPPRYEEVHYSVFHEITLNPGEQYTILPDTPHWFQGGPRGAVVSEFSTSSHDETDIFRDSRIHRKMKIGS